MTIEVLGGRYAVCKLKQAVQIPPSAQFFSLSVTDNEISLVCEESQTPQDCEAQMGFAAMRVWGVLDFSLVGILAKISGVLAQAGVSIFVVSTFKTDYILVKHTDLKRSVESLTSNGYQINQ